MHEYRLYVYDAEDRLPRYGDCCR